MTNTYYYRNSRGPGYGHQPDGFNPDTRQSGRAKRETPLGPRSFYGSVEYPKPLAMEQIYKFELWAANPIQWAKYFAWDYFRKSVNNSLYLFKRYTEALADPKQAHLIENDVEAVVCEILLEAGITIKSLEKEFADEGS